MSKSTSHTNTPEGRLAEALISAANKNVSLSQALEQISGTNRLNVERLLSGDSGKTVETPVPYRVPAVIIPQSAEIKKAIEDLGLEEGFTEAMDTQRTFQLLRTGQEAPDFGRILKAFTPEMLTAIQNAQNPQLILKTQGRSFNDLVSAMNGHKTMPGQDNAYVNDLFHRHAGQKSENWGAYIIESPTDVEVQDFDNTDLVKKERLAVFASHKKTTGVNGMDRWKFTHAMMQALKEGNSLDVKFWTMLDEDPALSASQLPYACWLPVNRRVYFFWGHPGDPSGIIRFRRSVGGDVQNA